MSQSTQRRWQVIANHFLSKPLQLVSHASSTTPKEPKSLHESIQFVVHPDVKHALQNNGPVVALESTIISHGMPYPQNVETAILVENQVKNNGAVPATIAILDGIIHIGLDQEQLKRLGQLGQKCIKTSRRDIAVVCSKKQNGATTVSATMILANMFGIHVFVTGGIGGVHRGVEETLDISADLTELGRTPVCVVCAGVKSILDIPRTLEYLETNGVTVASYGTDEFPAFFSSKSGSKTQTRFDTPDQCAQALLANLELNMSSGMVVAVPIPKHEEAKTGLINTAIEQALKELKESKIGGKDATPFLLKRVNELTKGDSLKASMFYQIINNIDIALILNNAAVGAQIAKEFSKRVCNENKSIPSVILVGGAVLDITSSPRDKLVSMTSNPGPVKLSFGGVARNVAEVLKKLQVDAFLVSAVGNDDFGNLLKNHLKEEKFDLQGIITGSNRTAVYNCIMDEKGEMISAIADMDILEEISPQHVERVLKLKMISNGKRTIFLDGNVSIGVFQTVARLAKESNYNIFFDPTSVPKSVKPIDAKCLGDLTFIKPNEDELFAMAKRVKKNVKSMDDCMELLLRQGVKHVLLTRGDKGVVYATLVNNKMKKQFFNTFPLPPNSTRNVTGCGDNFCGGFLFGITNDYSIEKSIVLGMRAAHLTLQLPYAVHPDLSVNSIL